MALYQIENVTFAYPNATKASLAQVSFNVEEGDFVLLCGPSGSGKTTLLRQLKHEVQPEGALEGTILYKGNLLADIDQTASIEEIGFVFQDPDNQIVMHTVWQELTFSMENLGYTTTQIERRMGELVPFFGMEEWLFREIHELSGGQKQLVNLASVMALQPKVLLLDEPTAQLDPIGAKAFLQMLHRIHEELAVTIIMSEHRLEEVYPYASTVVMLQNGRCTYAGTPGPFLEQLWHGEHRELQHYIPSIAQLFLSTNVMDDLPLPLTVKQGKQWIRKAGKDKKGECELFDGESGLVNDAEVLLQCRKLHFQYAEHTPKVLKELSLSIRQGEFFTLFGGNGSGKSTLLHNIVGIVTPQRGKISFAGKSMKKMSAKERSIWIGYVAQNPALYFTKETVREQLVERYESVAQGQEGKLEELIQVLSIADVLDRHPFDISGGEQQKVVIALALLADPALLILDEPTKGLDPYSKQQFALLLERLRGLGKTIFMVSHDIEFAAQYATRCGMLFNGKVISVEETKSFLRDNYFYTTMIHRTVGEWLPNAVTVEDALAQWGT